MPSPELARSFKYFHISLPCFSPWRATLMQLRLARSAAASAALADRAVLVMEPGPFSLTREDARPARPFMS
eukprot:14408079-Alexandrium_andersonii.AAC.1